MPEVLRQRSEFQGDFCRRRCAGQVGVMRVCRKVVFKARCRGAGRRVKRNDRREIELSAPKLERPLPAEVCRLPALPEQLAWLAQSVRIAGLSPKATGRSRLRLGTAYLRMRSAVSSACDHIYKDASGQRLSAGITMPGWGATCGGAGLGARHGQQPTCILCY